MADQESTMQDTQQVVRSSQAITSTMVHSSSGNTFAPKLSMKLQENNFLMWNQHIEGVILSHKLHKVVVNPQIPSMFKTDNDMLANIISEEYESWIVQDQTLFTLLLSIIFESVLPRVLSLSVHTRCGIK